MLKLKLYVVSKDEAQVGGRKIYVVTVGTRTDSLKNRYAEQTPYGSLMSLRVSKAIYDSLTVPQELEVQKA